MTLRSVLYLLCLYLLGVGPQKIAMAQDSQDIGQQHQTVESISTGEETQQEIVCSDEEECDKTKGNGKPTWSQPAAGALLFGDDPHKAVLHCSGTLISRNVFLTAAHCFQQTDKPKLYQVFFPQVGFFGVTSIKTYTPPENKNKEQETELEKTRDYYNLPDIALVTLNRPVVGIEPVALSESGNPLVETHAFLMNGFANVFGFGQTEDKANNSGLKRDNRIVLVKCPLDKGAEALCWPLDEKERGQWLNNSCYGDSGSGVLAWEKGRQTLVGVTTSLIHPQLSGNRKLCMTGLGLATSIYTYLSKLKYDIKTASSMHDDSSAGTNQTLLTQKIRLNSSNMKIISRIMVPREAVSLHLTMNAEMSSNGKFAISAFHENDLAKALNMCEKDGLGVQFASCEIADPRPGAWLVSLERQDGAGQIQLTASVLIP